MNNRAIVQDKNEKRERRKRTFNQTIVHIIVIILMILVFAPIYLLIIKSFKDPNQELSEPFKITFPFFFENYKLAWLVVKDYLLNSVIIAVGQTLGTVMVCAAASFGFVRYDFPLKKVLFIAILSLMMIPGILTLIPQFQIVMNVFKMKNNYFGVILPSVTSAVPMGVFLLNTFFQGLPKDLFEAAELDGASKWFQFIFLALPLSVPILATLGMMQFLGAWNDLLWPQLILQDEKMQTITVGLVPFTNSYYNAVGSFGVPFAGYVIVSIPLIVVFFFTSKQFIKGLTSGAFKM